MSSAVFGRDHFFGKLQLFCHLPERCRMPLCIQDDVHRFFYFMIKFIFSKFSNDYFQFGCAPLVVESGFLIRNYAVNNATRF